MAGRPKRRERIRQSKLMKGPRFRAGTTRIAYTAESNREAFNRCWRAMRHRLEPRVCVWCKHAFISCGGQNLCHPCHEVMRREFQATIHPSHPDNHVYVTYKWLGWWKAQHFNRPKTTLHPMIPVPDLDSPAVQSALNRAFDILRRALETGDRPRLVRLPGLPPYPHLEFRGFKRGRPSRLNAIYGKENGI